MKHLLLILFAFVALASAELSDVEKAIIYTAELLATDYETAEMCLRDANVTVDDLVKVSKVLEQLYSTFVNNKDMDTIRKGACAFTYCAKKRGVVSGSKIQIDKMEDIIEKKKMPLKTENYYKRIARECMNRVKDITDECFVGLEFYKCLIHLIDHGSAYSAETT
ncbi:uncharacterized protein LOC122534659 [Frieseomelitta varia]|uniref:uncharacterized protein LOC122534659 n=1 Tax=Frieseomelitta varia TaxID=561572 RepID=UPI001CB6A910|nr:uncharacterized protein LOC122534659 [Frieseomelitta varia]